MGKIKTALLFSLTFNLVILLYVSNKVYLEYKIKEELGLKNKQKGIPEFTYYFKRDMLFEILPEDSNSIVFLGNSLTQNFELSEFFNNLKIKNRGINSDLIEGVINRLDPVIKTNPAKIFIEIGINDLFRGFGKYQVINNYKRLIDTLQGRLPETKIYIQSLLPIVTGDIEFVTFKRDDINDLVIEINRELRSISEDRKLIFIDTHSKFVLSDQLNPRYSIDGIHLSAEGYQLWADVLKPFVNN